MKGPMVAFAGRIGSGKTTLSQGVAERLRWPRVSFGDFVRAEARRLGLDDSRDTLQGLGESLAAGGWTAFCRAVLAQVVWLPGEAILVDGVRHIEALNALKGLARPSPVYLVYLALDTSIQAARLANNGIEGAELRRVEAHSTEEQVAFRLRAAADLVVDASADLDLLLDATLGWIESKATGF